jgi:uncharacterized C2H2 Zn-finger protein
MIGQNRHKALGSRSPLAWLLHFAQLDIASLTRAAAWRIARHEAVPFLRIAGSRPSAWAEDQGGGGRAVPRRSGPSIWDTDPRPALSARQARTRALLAMLRDERGAPVDARLELRLAELVWEVGSPVTWRVGGDESHRFDGAIALALQRDGERLRRCPGSRCVKLFVKQHRQRYCSPACAARTRQARFARRNPTARRLRYESRIRKRMPYARIGTRSRARVV